MNQEITFPEVKEKKFLPGGFSFDKSAINIDFIIDWEEPKTQQ